MKKIIILLSIILLLVSCSTTEEVDSSSVSISLDNINLIRLSTSTNSLTYEPDEEWDKLVYVINSMKYTRTSDRALDELYEKNEKYFNITLLLEGGFQNIVIFENKAITYYVKSVNEDLNGVELLETSDDDVQELFFELSSINFPAESILLKKPVIYIYPEKKTEINVEISPSSILTSSYPQYDGGWNLFVEPSGIIIDRNEKQYSYLFWEGRIELKDEFRDGFVIPKDKTIEFLEEKLEYMGLNFKERNDFITYWLPELESNNYNKIRFLNKEYEELVKLNIIPTPDTVIRVLMIYEGLEEYEEIEPQTLQPVSREGYTVVEWGGAEVSTNK